MWFSGDLCVEIFLDTAPNLHLIVLNYVNLTNLIFNKIKVSSLEMGFQWRIRLPSNMNMKMRRKGILRCNEDSCKWVSCSPVLPGENVGCQGVRVVLGWMEQKARRLRLAQRKTGMVADRPGHNGGDSPMWSGHGHLPVSSQLLNSCSLVLEFETQHHKDTPILKKTLLVDFWGPL